MTLTYCKISELTAIGGVKGKHNITFWHAKLDKPICDALLGSVVLYPDLSRFNINVQQAVVDSFLVIPAHSY